MNTTWEQLEGAALALVRSAPIKDRLADAFTNHLAHVDPEALPDALRAEFRACNEALTRERPQRGEDAVRATVRKMSSHQADEVACSLVRLYGALVRESARAALPDVILTTVPAPSAARPKKVVPQVISLYAHEA